MTDDELTSHRLGTVTLDPSGPVVAGSVGQWTLTYTVGSYGIDEGGTLKLAQRFASDWETPQFDQPAAPGYTTVTTDGPARLRAYFHRKGHERPWMKCTVIDVYDGSLAPGDTVTIVLGDRSQGSPGIRAQTFQESAHEFRLLVDPTNASVALPLPTSPLFPVIPGPPVELVCILPSQAVVGEPVEIFVKGQDAWGNPTPAPDSLKLVWSGEGAAEIAGNRLFCRTPGTGWLLASAGSLTCRSNPITAYSTPPTRAKYWGDLHAQTAGTVGTGTEAEYFTFGRDVARLDFASHQGNDFQMDDAYWAHLNRVVSEFHSDGRFVVFPGYEWSANTPAGGDRNVIYRQEGQPIFRSSHWQIPHTPEDASSPAHPASELFARIRQHIPPEDVLLGSHVGGRYADIRRYFDEELGPLVEVVSCWGVFEWMLWDAFEMGYTVGVMCNSDGHKGRPGAEGPGAGEFGIGGGLTCVLAEELGRDALFAALKARRCYGTTGPRIALDFTIDDQPMGSVIDASGPVDMRASVIGCGPLESLTLFQGREAIAQVCPAAFTSGEPSCRVRVSWRGARMRGRGRRVVWDGAIRIEGAAILAASPFAFDSAADGITGQDGQQIAFASSTTGDTDGIDLRLDRADGGRLIFESTVGRCEVDLAELRLGPEESDRQRLFDFGGLGMQVCVERYPEVVEEYSLQLTKTLSPPAGKRTPYFVKALQTDGHAAWSSPIYINGHKTRLAPVE